MTIASRPKKRNEGRRSVNKTSDNEAEVLLGYTDQEMVHKLPGTNLTRYDDYLELCGDIH